MSDRALIYGTMAIDTLITPQGQVNAVMGGSGVYAALAARFVSSKFDLTGVVGEDWPAEYTAALEARGVSMAHVAHEPGQTFAWTGAYEEDMNNRRSVSTVEGVQETWVMQLPEELRSPAVACACNVRPRLQLRMLEQCAGARFTMADFMESWILRERDRVDSILQRVDLALMNDSEARSYTGTPDSIEAGYRLLEAGPRYAVVKHGSAGATLFHRAAPGNIRLFRCPAYPIPHPQDPTGAGDAFMGALAACLCPGAAQGEPEWEDMKCAVAIASVAAAAVCEKFGTISLFALSREAFRERVAAFREMTCW